MTAPGSEVIDAIAVANQHLADLATGLRRRPEVVRVDHCLSCRPDRSPGAVMLDIYVDAELRHGPGLVWYLDIWWYPHWGIAASIAFVYGEDRESVRRFPERRAADADEFVVELQRTVGDLVADAATIDIASFLARWPESLAEP